MREFKTVLCAFLNSHLPERTMVNLTDVIINKNHHVMRLLQTSQLCYLLIFCI